MKMKTLLCSLLMLTLSIVLCAAPKNEVSLKTEVKGFVKEHVTRIPPGALIEATKKGELETVKNLINEKLVNVNYMDKHGYTALAWAATRGHKDIVDFLIETKESTGLNINVRSPHGETALIIAAEEGYVDIVKSLYNAGAEDVPAYSENYALSYAALQGHTEVVRFLVEKDAKGMPTAFLYAATGGYVEIVKILVDKDANLINIVDSNGYTAIMRTIDRPGKSRNGAVEIVEFLASKEGIDLDHSDGEGNTALTLAAFFKMEDIIDILIKHGANLEASIELAQFSGDEEVVARLRKAKKKKLSVMLQGVVEAGRSSK